MSGLEDGYALGLDLGTTFSCIGVFRNGGVEIIPNSNGEKVTPSIVTFLDEKNILKGEEAEEYLVKNYETSIYAIKRFIGRDIKDKKVQEEIKQQNYPFNIVNKNNIPKVEIVKIINNIIFL
jgi:molecular chaperone DnaK (HSP70)